MQKRILNLMVPVLTGLALAGLTACAGKADGPARASQSAEVSGTEEITQNKSQAADPSEQAETEEDSRGAESGRAGSWPDSASPDWKKEAARESLARLVEAIEKQFPDESFRELPDSEAAKAAGQFAGSYYFAGREAASGWQFIVGVSHVRDNPLEGMTCGAQGAPSGYNVGQFHNGSILLLEKGNTESGLSYLYDILQHGDAGADYLLDAADRGVRLIPPDSGPFLKVSMVKNGIPVNEFVTLTEEEAAELRDGRKVDEKTPAKSRIALCFNREELSSVWSGQGELLTEQMIELAKERCGFETGEGLQIPHFVKAKLTADFYGEQRSETIANKSDLELLEEKLKNGVSEDEMYGGSFDGSLTLTAQDGSQVHLQLASAGGGGYVLGNASYYKLSEEDTAAVWSAFTQIDGWRRYGGQIRMVMDKSVWDEDSAEFTFTLENKTGNPIQYILTPIFHRKTEKDETGDLSDPEWQLIEGISGYCGFTTDMEGDAVKLSVSWKDAFVSRGPGLYRLEIQVMPEPGLRFPISDYFELK